MYIYIYIYYMYVCMYVVCMSGARVPQNRTSDLLELELQMTVSHHVGPGNLSLSHSSSCGVCHLLCWVGTQGLMCAG